MNARWDIWFALEVIGVKWSEAQKRNLAGWFGGGM
jgi:hypothetical protein